MGLKMYSSLFFYYNGLKQNGSLKHVQLLIYEKLHMTFAIKGQSETISLFSLIINKGKVAYIRPSQISSVMQCCCCWQYKKLENDLGTTKKKVSPLHFLPSYMVEFVVLICLLMYLT